MTPRVAIFVVVGFFLKRLPSVQLFPDDDSKIEHILHCLDWLVSGHLTKLNEVYAVANPWSMLYRVFYYDAVPYQDNARTQSHIAT